MLSDFILQPNEAKRIQLDGKWLVVNQATGAIELTIGGTNPIIVDEKGRIHLRDLSPNDRAVRIRNISGAVNTIQLHTSDLLVDKRTAVDLKNAIEIAPDQLIGIDQNANIVQSIIQNPVCIDEACNTVQLKKQAVTYRGLPTVVFEEDGSATDPIVLPETIPENANRKTLILYANVTNSAVVWIGGEENSGIPMLPNDKLTLTVTEPLTVIGAVGNWLHVAELISEEVA